jgi:hypothetical protein
MIVSLVVELNRQPSETIDVPATVCEFSRLRRSGQTRRSS